MNLSWILGLFSCAISPPFPRGPDPRVDLARRVAEKSELAVLFVGNSYSFGVPRAFAKVAAAHGRTVRVGHSTHGGWSLERHSTHEPTLRKIRQGKWDVVVLQEHSEIPARLWVFRDFLMVRPLRVLVTEVRQAGALPVLYQTWGRRDRFMRMNARVREGYRAAAKDAGGLLVIPVGDAWEVEMAAGRGAGLFMEDGSHPTAAGDALSARVIYETLFGRD